MQKLRFFLISLFVLLTAGVIALVYILNSFPPGGYVTALVYALSWLSTFSLATLLGIYVRRLFGHREFVNRYIARATRQGVWFGLILVTSLYLSHKGLFTWLNAGLLLLTFVFFEGYLLTRDDKVEYQ